jgi:hypothetical protein
MHCKKLVNDILPCPQGKSYWHFYDWADGLSGSIAKNDKDALIGNRFDAILNFFFILALDEIAYALDCSGKKYLAKDFCTQAHAMRKASHEMFWNDARKCYKSFSGENAVEHYAEMTQSLALLARVPSAEDADVLRKKLTEPNNGLVPVSLGMAIYKYDAILKGSQEFRTRAIEMVTEQWQKMVYEGASTFWETIKGQADFSGAGSLCHGFSTLPAYIYHGYVLGVIPIEPGFSKFNVNPSFRSFESACGRIPTPKGFIEISWEKQGDSYLGNIKHPKDLQPVFSDSQLKCKWKIETV